MIEGLRRKGKPTVRVAVIAEVVVVVVIVEVVGW